MLVALLVTFACLPLLVLDVVSGTARTGAEGSTAGPDPSLVVATLGSAVPAEVDPSSVELDSPTTTVPEVELVVVPPTTVARVPETTTTTRPMVVLPPLPQSDVEFLACVRDRESHGDYSVADPTGRYLGAYQIVQGTWDTAAAAIGRTDLVGVPPNHASPAEQDLIAVTILARSGRGPWGGSCH